MTFYQPNNRKEKAARKWKLSLEYRWSEVYEHAKINADNQKGKMK